MRTLPLGTWKAPDPAVREGPLVFEARFDAPKRKRGESAKLLLNPLGPTQTVTLNGRVLLAAASAEALRRELDLASLELKPKNNVLRIESQERFVGWSDRERVGQRQPAAVAFVQPAAPAYRSTFNGLAQVILQSTGSPGEISLEAVGDGVKSAKLSLAAKP
jgi:beta-galactosidase